MWMDEGTPERALGNWLIEQGRRPLFRLVSSEIDGIADHEELRRAVEMLVVAGYVKVTRKPMDSIYVEPTEEGSDVFWGAEED